jgi:hypothetical protein
MEIMCKAHMAIFFNLIVFFFCLFFVLLHALSMLTRTHDSNVRMDHQGVTLQELGCSSWQMCPYIDSFLNATSNPRLWYVLPFSIDEDALGLRVPLRFQMITAK